MVSPLARHRVNRVCTKLKKLSAFAALRNLTVAKNNEIVTTACLFNRTTIFYNSTFVDRLSEDELTSVIAHEILHHTLRHRERREGRCIYVWQLAIDYEVNSKLLRMGFMLPDLTKIRDKFGDSPAETIYDIIEKYGIGEKLRLKIYTIKSSQVVDNVNYGSIVDEINALNIVCTVPM